MNDRGQATGIANFFLAILVGAIMTWILDEVTSPLVSRMQNQTAATDTVGTTMNDWWVLIFDNQPVMFLLITFFSLIALSVFQRAVLR